jgi:hypothetical protein
MHFYTPAECARQAQELSIALNPFGKPVREFIQPFVLHASFPTEFSRLLTFSRLVDAALQPRKTCLLWVTDFGIYPSNENHQLYYRWRQSYGDPRLLQDAPGHVCLDYERGEVVTLVHLAVLFGWDLHLIPTVGYARAFVCHDEWAEIGFDNRTQLDQTRQSWEKAGLEVSIRETGEPGGAGNRSQPVGPETNRTSGAAGSGA